ncbi:hypothetical protein CHLRE_09g404950v5 [Chlamydomonas reinhardtii]|uniref:Uncharacterized protein n=1 Tax=Chlamydomonas reinhardtii TaxID=3055 RepID=A0A2K3DCJ6_CHLRE|nr:uncharacterized protein CHLRE_09g404950v5 [Chlamydomonas reinhardtii]PNW78252.1 hypothetical protein CHLRE_09g404950v5 [Chlamydomonas reinhardtii]
MPTSVAPLSEELTVKIEHGGVEDVAACSDQDIADVEMARYKALDARAKGVPVTNKTIAMLAKDSQALAANAGPQNWGLTEMSAMMDEKLGGLKTEMSAMMGEKIGGLKTEMSQEMSAMMGEKIGGLKTEMSQEMSVMMDEKISGLKTYINTKFDEMVEASNYAVYNEAARRSNAAAPSDAPLVKLKKERGSGAGTVPACPPFPVRKADLLHSITPAHINELERFYDVKFEAMAAPEPAVGGPAASTRSTNQPQRRQQLATFLGVP